MTVLLRGGGDLASGVALRMHRIGIKVVILELSQPLSVRRKVSFSEAVYDGKAVVEGITARVVESANQCLSVIDQGEIPVLVDPQANSIKVIEPVVVVDARMMKHTPDISIEAAPIVVGLGPGFIAGKNCHAVIETKRGHTLGRVIWKGKPHPNTGVPGKIGNQSTERVLRAPTHGVINTFSEIGDIVHEGQVVGEINHHPIEVPISGVLRGLLRSGIPVSKGLKIGDIDPRSDPSYCFLVSEKSLAIAGGVLEAILSRDDIRRQLWLER